MISVAKGLLLLAAAALFAGSNTPDNLLLSLKNYLYGWPYAIYPAYWFIVTFACLLLVFPLTLAQDHLMRAAEGNHDEMPVSFWMNGLLVELLFGTVTGCLISGSMFLSPTFWWMIISVIWMAYNLLTPKIQAGLITDEDRKKSSLSDLRELLMPLLKESGIELKDVHIQDDEDIPDIDADVVFTFEDGKAVVYIPPVWAHTWKPDEIAAVTLHKAWMMRKDARRNEFILNLMNALFCFGGYALLYPWLQKLGFCHGPIHALINAPTLFIWLMVSTFTFRIMALAIYRKWMYQADAAVVLQMKTPQSLINAFERAHHESPLLTDYPRWAEVLLFHSPSMHRRITRLKQ